MASKTVIRIDMTLIFLVLTLLKLFGVEPIAGLSWWWITAPLWLPVVLFIVIPTVVILFIVAVVWFLELITIK